MIDHLYNLPADWSRKRLKFAAFIDTSGIWGGEPGERERDLPTITTANIDNLGRVDLSNASVRSYTVSEAEYYRCRPGDIIVVKASGSATSIITGKCAQCAKEDGEYCFGNFTLRVRADEIWLSDRFLFYFLISEVTKERIKVMVSTTTYPNLKVGEYIGHELPLPPLETQRRIAQFLDEKTARIDGLIEKKRALLDRLAEKRQALITRAVTKGLNPDAPMRPSGIDWLGDIPAHWEVKRLRFLLDGGTINGLYKPKDQFTVDGVAFVQMGEAFRGVTFDGGTNDRVLASTLEVKKWGLKEGDFLIARRSLVFEGSGKSVRISHLSEDHLFESSMIRIRPLHAEKISGFLSYYFQSAICRAAILSITKQVTISGIDSQQLRDIWVPVPPLDEALAIWKACIQSDNEHEAVGERIRESINQLAEYRAALITAAVTGQLEVP